MKQRHLAVLLSFLIVVQMFSAPHAMAIATSTNIASLPAINALKKPYLTGNADGTKIISAGSGLYLSTNSGVSFTSITPSSWSSTLATNPVSAAWISEDGNKIVAVQYNGDLAISLNSGSTWSFAGLTDTFIDVSASATMSKIYAITEVRTLYSSANSGSTWSSTSTGGSGSPFTSGNFGVNQNFMSIQTSSTGTNIGIVARNGFYRSTDSGSTWTMTDNIDGSNGSCCNYSAMSTDGQTILVADNGKGFYLSKNYGASFTQIPMATFEKMAGQSAVYGYGTGVSADGTKLIAYNFGVYAYSSNDGGTTWVAETNAGLSSWGGRAFVANNGNAIIQSNSRWNWVSNPTGLAYSLSNILTSTLSISLNGGVKTATFRSSSPITATISVAGKVTLFANGKVIPGCKSISGTGSVQCNWKPSNRGSTTITGRLLPTDNNYLSSVASPLSVSVTPRTTSR